MTAVVPRAHGPARGTTTGPWHGTVSGYTYHRCRCRPCTTAMTRWVETRRLAILQGTWQGLVDASIAVDHIRRIHQHGMSVEALAAVTGVSTSVVTAVAWPNHSCARTVLRHRTAAALLTARCTHRGVPARWWVPAAGTTRRLQGLAALGWPLADIAARLDVTKQAVMQTIARPRVTAGKAQRVEDVHDALSMTPGPSRTTAHRAAAAGWLPPLAWDDDDIDDPEATPAGGCDTLRRSRPRFDPDEVEFLLDQGECQASVARILGIKETSLRTTLRHRHGRPDLVDRMDRAQAIAS